MNSPFVRVSILETKTRTVCWGIYHKFQGPLEIWLAENSSDHDAILLPATNTS
ncbi:hypothetical protein [Desulfomonile tiedjei]|nr:hypothetical protein [Desulfomonile tiedjei]